MELFDAEMLAKELMSSYVPNYHLGWNNLKTVNGMCVYQTRTIYLSRPLTLLRTPEAVCNTIMHEIAHALTPGAHHGYDWQMQMLKFGLKPERCSSDAVNRESISNWKATCKPCGRVYTAIRKQRVEKSCPCGGRKFNPKYVLTFVRI